MRFRRPRDLRTRPTVTVVIPCYNYGHYLPTAVSRALDQDGLVVDVIVVDDASTDGSLSVAERLAANDDRVQVIANAENKRHIETYNTGLREARGDYVTLVSADDALPPNALSRAVALMEHHPSVGMVYGYPMNFSDDLPTVADRVRSWSTWDGSEWFRRACRTGRCVIMSPEVVMRRTAWEQIGRYDVRIPHAADMAVWLSTSLRWDIGRVNGPPQAFYRVHGSNMHLTTFAGMLTDLRQRRRVFEVLFSEDHPLPADHVLLHRRARRALAQTALRLAVAENDAGHAPERDELVTFAEQTCPDLAVSAAGRRRLRRTLTATTASARFADRVQTHLAWRRWRRYGL